MKYQGVKVWNSIPQEAGHFLLENLNFIIKNFCWRNIAIRFPAEWVLKIHNGHNSLYYQMKFTGKASDF